MEKMASFMFIQSKYKFNSRGIDFYSWKCDNFIVLGNFNADFSNSFLEQSWTLYNLKSLIKEPTCFKSVNSPSYIYLKLTSHPKRF